MIHVVVLLLQGKQQNSLGLEFINKHPERAHGVGLMTLLLLMVCGVLESLIMLTQGDRYVGTRVGYTIITVTML